jgi:subtilisin family serine protease
MTEPSHQNTITGHQSDQLVVATPYQQPVLAAVMSLGLNSADEFDHSDELGLSLIRFDNSQLTGWWQGDNRQLGDSPIDALIAALRKDFSGRYNGWSPTLGKNRFVQHVDGFYHVGGWGEDGIVSIAPEQAPALRAGDAGKGVRVGVPDTAVYANSWLGGGFHALPSSVLQPAAAAPGGQQPLPLSAGHATFVAGRILMEAPGATVEVFQCLEADGQADVWQAAKALVALASSGVQVLNVSFGCQTEDGQPPLVLSAAVDRLPSDVLVVAAAGNFGGTSKKSKAAEADKRGAAWPAALDDVIAVGALDETGKVASFSPTAPWVDVYAPGVRVESTYLDGSFRVSAKKSKHIETPTGFARWSGTSFSAASVSGRIAAGIIPGQVDARTSFEKLRGSLQRTIELPGPRKVRAPASTR